MAKKISREEHRLNDRDIEMIAAKVAEMPVQLRPTWPQIIALAETITGQTYSRQSLSAHENIAKAYAGVSTRHQILKRGGKPPKPKQDNDSLKDQKIAKLEAEVALQRELIDALQDLLIRFVGNATLKGITQEQLEAELPARPERRSDVDAMAERTKEARKKQRRG